jgi:hypothetical protein
VLPITDRGAEDVVDESGIDDVIDDRTRAHVVHLVRQLCAVVDAAPEVTELVCDPVIARADGVDVIEVRVTLAPVEADDGPLVRRL